MTKNKNIAPTAHILRGIANENHDIATMFAEVIDNALDAGSKNVSIEIGKQKDGRPESLLISDDGSGLEDLTKMVRLGDHDDHDTTEIGMWGVGGSIAMIWLGGEDSSVQIESNHRGKNRTLYVNWIECGNNKWNIKDGWETPAKAVDVPSGTNIMIRPVARRMPEGARFDALLEKLGYLYWPALKAHGIKIEIGNNKHRQRVVCWKAPEITDVVDAQIDVCGKKATIHVGIIKAGEETNRRGISIVRKHRVVEKNGGLGCGGLPYTNISGYVNLSKEWTLAKHKDKVTDEHRDELGDAIFEKIREIVEKAASRTEELELDALNANAESLLNGALGFGDKGEDLDGPRKNKPRSPIGPKPRPGRRPKIDPKEKGSSLRKKFGCLRITYEDLQDPEKWGEYSEGYVTLNLGHKAIQIARAAKDGSLELAHKAITVFVHATNREESNGQRTMPYASNGDPLEDIGILSKNACDLYERRGLYVVSEAEAS